MAINMKLWRLRLSLCSQFCCWKTEDYHYNSTIILPMLYTIYCGGRFLTWAVDVSNSSTVKANLWYHHWAGSEPYFRKAAILCYHPFCNWSEIQKTPRIKFQYKPSIFIITEKRWLHQSRQHPLGVDCVTELKINMKSDNWHNQHETYYATARSICVALIC